MTIGLMTVLLRRNSMHISFVLETFRCRKLLLHQLEKRTTEKRYDWYEAKSLKRASMAVSSEALTMIFCTFYNNRQLFKQTFIFPMAMKICVIVGWFLRCNISVLLDGTSNKRDIFHYFGNPGNSDQFGSLPINPGGLAKKLSHHCGHVDDSR